LLKTFGGLAKGDDVEKENETISGPEFADGDAGAFFWSVRSLDGFDGWILRSSAGCGWRGEIFGAFCCCGIWKVCRVRQFGF
jgi:hypothetical protein